MNTQFRQVERTSDLSPLVSIVAAIGGLLFGYDTAVISGAIGFMQQKFNLDSVMTGWAVSCLMIGAIIGAAFAGALSDRFGAQENVDSRCHLVFGRFHWIRHSGNHFTVCGSEGGWRIPGLVSRPRLSRYTSQRFPQHGIAVVWFR